MRTNTSPLLLSFGLAIIIAAIYFPTRVHLSALQREKLNDVELPMDRAFVNARESGFISLTKFTALAQSFASNGESLITLSPQKDSLICRKPISWSSEKFRRIFFNGRIKEKWEQFYPNLPIRVLPEPNLGFVARIDTIKGRSFLYLPFEIVYSAIRSLPVQPAAKKI